jgi:hypothetical protein
VHAIVGVEVRMRVRLADAAVRRPARVADAGRGGRREHRDRGLAVAVALGDGPAQRGEVADGADRLEAVLGLDADAGGVVAAIFELLEPGQEDLLYRAVTHVAHDPAHALAPPEEWTGAAW